MSLQVTVDDGINELEISSVGGFGSVGTVVRGGPLGGTTWEDENMLRSLGLKG